MTVVALEGDRLLMRRGPGRVDALTVFPDGFSFAQGYLVVTSRRIWARDRLQRRSGGVWDPVSRQPDALWATSNLSHDQLHSSLQFESAPPPSLTN